MLTSFFLAKKESRKEIGENLSDLPEVGRLFVNLFFGVQKKTLCVLASLRANFFFSQRNKEIKTFESCLPKVGRLCVIFFCFLARKGAEAQRKNPFAALRLCVFARVHSFFILAKKRSR